MNQAVASCCQNEKPLLRTEQQAKRTYVPVIALFGMAALISIATRSPVVSAFAVGMRFLGLGTCLLAMQKLQNIASFTRVFRRYDLIAQRWPPYATLYPFIEALAGLGMLTRNGIAAPLAVTLGAFGTVAVINAVYVQKRVLHCACVGGESNVPLGAVSLLENVAMMLMGALMFGM